MVPTAESSRNRNKSTRRALSQRDKELEEETMPVIILWGIPTLLVLAGGGYWLVHMHH
jgi:hypothetical protein